MKLPQTIAWYMHRLRAMKPAEIRHRLEEKWRQFTQPGFLETLVSFDPGPASARGPRLPDKATASLELRTRLAADAQKLQAGQWLLFGWRELEVGSPPCWHRDAFCGVVIDPDKPAHLLNHRDLPDGADARTIWEINRWAEMTRLAMHGWLNGDAPAIRTAQQWLEDWCDRNPPGQGINWTSPLEAALRLINFTWFDALVAAHGGESLKKAQAQLVRRIVPVHAAWIWRYRSAGSSANNHLLGELTALVVAVSRWPGLSEVACSAETAWDVLEQEILHQFSPDGGSREQALHYHLFAFDLAWLAVLTVGCKAGPVYDRLAAASGYFQALAHGKEPWDFGDNDDAQVLPVTRDRSLAVHEWLEWLNGESGDLRFWLGVPPPALSVPPRYIFPASGMGIAAENGWKVRIDASPLGFGSLAAHGHGDALHVSVWDGDNALLVDPGTGGYYGHRQWRTELAAWTAHNGPQPLQGYQTPRRLGAFLWTRHHKTPALSMDASVITAELQHEGHHFKRSVSVTPEGVQIRDVEAEKKNFKVRLMFSPECQIKKISSGSENGFEINRETRGWTLFINPEVADALLTEGRASPAYGCMETVQVLELTSKQGELMLTIQRRF
ncbi:heparinase II/III-like protein [Prosthecobacter fusiformis]|uniref:Heparinase II/III-like protein n=1 Tax=Prosthecobacter fusiformis TaxID=48464 RepID=A0A4R7S4X3_9BACT|nr:alginate lyase family protein [Prosthecobacter fusiformis]TDU73411.1 heparinase II/III-like protein [Prosthecobacter fusiformis]